jgi:hypothetical protein
MCLPMEGFLSSLFLHRTFVSLLSFFIILCSLFLRFHLLFRFRVFPSTFASFLSVYFLTFPSISSHSFSFRVLSFHIYPLFFPHLFSFFYL